MSGFAPLSMRCAKRVVSDALSFGMIAASLFYRAPQMLKIAANGSAKGVSFAGICLEALCYLFNTSYFYLQGHSFRLYGENVVALAQAIALAGMLWRYGEISLAGLAGLAAGSGGFLLALVRGAVPASQARLLFLCSVAAYLLSRTAQCRQILRAGSARNLSLLTLSFSALACLGRAVTVAVDISGDAAAVGASLLQLAASALTLLTAFAFRNAQFRQPAKPHAQ